MYIVQVQHHNVQEEPQGMDYRPRLFLIGSVDN